MFRRPRIHESTCQPMPKHASIGKDLEMTVYDLIKGMPLFVHFSETEKKRFADEELEILELGKGDAVITEGELSRTLYLLISGSCLITKEQEGANIRLSRLGPGDIFGEMSWISGKPRQSNVVANEKSLLLQMDEHFFERLEPELSNKMKDYMIQLLTERLDKMNEAIMRISKLMRS